MIILPHLALAHPETRVPSSRCSPSQERQMRSFRRACGPLYVSLAMIAVRRVEYIMTELTAGRQVK